MQTTLKQFLNDRAKYDTLCANQIFLTSFKTIEALKNIKSLNERYPWLNTFGPTVQASLPTIALPQDELSKAVLLMLSAAGEAAKKLNRNVPDFESRFPNVGLKNLIKNLKRIRDLTIHLDETLPDSPERKKVLVEINANINEISSRPPIDTDDPIYKGLPYFRLMCVAANYGVHIDAFQRSSKSNPLYLHLTSPAVQNLAQQIGMPTTHLPLFFGFINARDQLNVLCDCMNMPSLLFKSANSQMYSEHNSSGSIIKIVRNRLAHYKDFFDANARTSSESYRLTFDVFENLREVNALSEASTAITRKLAPLRDALNAHDDQEYISRLAISYEKSILGKSMDDPSKRVLIDQFTDFIVKNFKGQERFQEQSIIAAGAVLQKLPAAQAKDVFKYLYANIKNLMKKNANHLVSESSNTSNVVRMGTDIFEQAMSQAAKISTDEPNRPER